MIKIISPWLYPLAWMSLIFIGSSIRMSEDISPIVFSDKIVHFIEFGILGILFFNAVLKKTKIKKFFLLLTISVFLSTSYGLLDEIHQLYVPTRVFDLADLLADCLGSFFFCLCFYWYLNKRKSYFN